MPARAARLHRSRGVDLRFDTRVACVLARDDRVTALDLSDGTRLATDMVLVGIGASPNDALASAAGLRCEDGVVVDSTLRSSDRRIFSIGDCCRFPLPDGRMIRLESVQNAVDQAKHLAKTLTGDPSPYAATPWFWSDQFDVKLQIAGLLPEGQTAGPAPAAPPGFSVDHAQDGQLMCRESVNDFRAHLSARKSIGAPVIA
ncbi:MAG: FAD-dependent oxidoreductase [Pararhodobacter sp.]